MKRELVSQNDLLKWMNSQLALHDECTNCRFKSVQGHEEDHEGCNWSPHVLRCSGVPTEVCTPIANQVVAQARSKFNLK